MKRGRRLASGRVAPVRRWQDVAIIGMAGRFPEADDVDVLWRNLEQRRDCITRLSDAQLEMSGVPPGLRRDPRYVKAAPLLKGHDLFAADFFGYSRFEAELMDPQQRVFLECAWTALESAGYCADRGDVRAAVFAGSALNTYLTSTAAGRELCTNYVPALIANDKDFLATRVAFKLNLSGPAVTVQTACSTSLVAIHLACACLVNGEADMALAGGVSVRVPQLAGYLFNAGSIVSPDGHCRPFDAAANGTVFGSGVGIVVLKRLDEALADRDNVLAVIKGTAINNDGSDKASFAAPRVAGQAAAILEALAVGGVDADTLSFVEAHGTGTVLGDPIEVQALTTACRHHTDRRQFCSLGSIKGNVGHLDAAAGVTSVIKCIQAFRHQRIPGIAHFERPNPEIDFEHTPFRVGAANEDWPRTGRPRRCAVNGLGVGGTNAFVVLEEPPQIAGHEGTRVTEILPVSARSGHELDEYRRNLAAFFQNGSALVADACFTMRLGRPAFACRRALVISPNQDGTAVSRCLARGELIGTGSGRPDRRVVFLFNGVSWGSRTDWSEFVVADPGFRRQLDVCEQDIESTGFRRAVRRRTVGVTRVRASAPEAPPMTASDELLFGLAFANYFIACGVDPLAVVGIGLGQLVSACLAGIMSVSTALWLSSIASGMRMTTAPLRQAPIVAADAGARLYDGLTTVQLGVPRLPIFSTVKSEWISDKQATDPTFWIAELAAPTPACEWRTAVESEHQPLWLTFGLPRKTREYNRGAATDIAALPSSERMAHAIAGLWTCGAYIHWERLAASRKCGRIAMPTYPYARQRYWMDDGRPKDQRIHPAPSGAADHLSRNQLVPRDPALRGRAEWAPKSCLGVGSTWASPLHSAIATIWRDLFGSREFGPRDDFFELGGDSIMMIEVIERINRIFAIDLPVVSMFESPTIDELAALVRRMFEAEMPAGEIAGA